MYKPLLVLSVALLSALLIAGCSYQPARIKSEPLIVIDDDRGGHHGGGFCPPGQAKKGNC
ncbi:hypothetical protein L861_01815 [Litchfieldella anticariensis FP35 = DSM 16096]|uniref:Lipoprotein n=1 Tax=Litchfieldella anticariensis (strain DSM 16096 / CECT 5854 / CIP 108499 / LMG 22089 / FP35) TaxID=1121939 RepID=S2KU23_LITA3|nr:hypothetical protein [Halomonas anticariensis]EPC04068.1 hypothetical protein L861_01815 [Halomonas anticariensis FP35 = DSM 16096]